MSEADKATKAFDTGDDAMRRELDEQRILLARLAD
jgi:hypothetical protein